jgi:hypothetical protein
MIYNNEAKGLRLVPAVIVTQHDLTGFFIPCVYYVSSDHLIYDDNKSISPHSYPASSLVQKDYSLKSFASAAPPTSAGLRYGKSSLPLIHQKCIYLSK